MVKKMVKIKPGLEIFDFFLDLIQNSKFFHVPKNGKIMEKFWKNYFLTKNRGSCRFCHFGI